MRKCLLCKLLFISEAKKWFCCEQCKRDHYFLALGGGSRFEARRRAILNRVRRGP